MRKFAFWDFVEQLVQLLRRVIFQGDWLLDALEELAHTFECRIFIITDVVDFNVLQRSEHHNFIRCNEKLVE